jgi:alcohol dehydrogenase class IV
MYKIYCRTYQTAFKIASNFLPWRKPELIEGENAVKKLPKIIKEKNIDNILIVTDKGIVNIGLMNPLLEELEKEKIKFFIYDKTVPNPTIDNIEEALLLYKKNKCQALLAFGGGSPIDCAKGIGARLARPDKTISQMKGVLKVRKPMPTFFAVPTTAGTGSETTIAAVITDSRTHEKYGVGDLPLIPHYAVLDPLLTINLPPHITSTTGIDALTHAVEAYIGRSNTKETRQNSIEAIKLIFENINEVYKNGKNIKAREKMLKASFLAGAAFTRAYVGYVHAIAHTLGGFYSLPHGLANAIILPYVLEYYGETVYKSLSELADLTGITSENDTQEQKAKKFIEKIKTLNKELDIRDKIPEIQTKDIEIMSKRALKEANPLYPVPKIMNYEEMKKMYHIIKGVG